MALALIAFLKVALGYHLQYVNTIVFWVLIACSYGLAPKTYTVAYTFVIFVIIFVLLEILNFAMHNKGISLWNEQERVDSCYQWLDVYLSEKGKNKLGDLTEGYFANDRWDVSPDVALKQKYDKFYEILNLAPGMRVLDIGCGYGQWMSYLKSRGVSSVGFTLAQNHVDEGKERGLDIRLQDGRSMPAEYMSAFDAVTLLGSLEHFAKMHWSKEKRLRVYASVLNSARRALNAKSESRRIMTTTINVVDIYKPSDLAMGYLLERFYSGRYPEIDELYSQRSEHLERVHNSDQSEDYRYMSIINPDHFGNFKIEWTLRKVLFVPFMFMTDPFAIHKWLYHNLGVWMWQFGGASPIPSRSRKSPCRLKWEAFEMKTVYNDSVAQR